MPALFLKGLERPLVFSPETAHLAEMLRSILIGWPMRLVRHTKQDPLLCVSTEGRDTVIERPADDGIFNEPTAVSAVCSMVVEIVDALVAGQPDTVCLHAAAAEFCGRLVLFPAAHRAGKSTLMARLSAGGRRIFADDILPFDLSTGEAVSTGCLPRLRLPLPRGSSREFRTHVRNRAVLDDGYYAYLSAPQAAKVRFGERLGLGAVVLLERSERPMQARLEPAPLDRALLEILMRNTRGDRNAPLLLSTFVSIMREVPVQRLVYSHMEDAVDCLDTAFAEWRSRRGLASRLTQRQSRRETSVSSDAAAPAPETGAPLYRRNPSVTLEQVDASGFLVDTGNNSIHVLDLLGLGVWNLLEWPQDARALAGVVAQAFPETPRRKVADDIDRLLSALAGKGLIERIGASSPSRHR